MSTQPLERIDEHASGETPEDVAILYSWANLQGAKYRDFSANRREYRAQMRHRAAEQLRLMELRAQSEAEAAAAQAEAESAAAHAEAEMAAAKLAVSRATPSAPEEIQEEKATEHRRKTSLREAAQQARRAAAERLEAARRAESAALADSIARREEREIVEAQASALRQAAQYESEMRSRQMKAQEPDSEVPGIISDPYSTQLLAEGEYFENPGTPISELEANRFRQQRDYIERATGSELPVFRMPAGFGEHRQWQAADLAVDWGPNSDEELSEAPRNVRFMEASSARQEPAAYNEPAQRNEPDIRKKPSGQAPQPRVSPRSFPSIDHDYHKPSLADKAHRVESAERRTGTRDEQRRPAAQASREGSDSLQRDTRGRVPGSQAREDLHDQPSAGGDQNRRSLHHGGGGEPSPAFMHHFERDPRRADAATRYSDRAVFEEWPSDSSLNELHGSRDTEVSHRSSPSEPDANLAGRRSVTPRRRDSEHHVETRVAVEAEFVPSLNLGKTAVEDGPNFFRTLPVDGSRNDPFYRPVTPAQHGAIEARPAPAAAPPEHKVAGGSRQDWGMDPAEHQPDLSGKGIAAPFPGEAAPARWFALQGMFSTPERVTDGRSQRPRRTTGEVPLIAVFSLAGGTGKTSLVATLGRTLSSLGERVLLADTMSTGLLPLYFGAQEHRPGLVRTFTPPSGRIDAPIHLVTYSTDEASDPDSRHNVAEDLLGNSERAQRVLVDLNVNSRWLVESVASLKPTILVPLTADMNSIVSLQAVDRLFGSMKDAGGEPLRLLYLLNQFDASLPLHHDVREMLRQQLGERLLPMVIRRAAGVSEALAEGMTIVDYDPDSPATQDYLGLANWIRATIAPCSTGFRSVRWSER